MRALATPAAIAALLLLTLSPLTLRAEESAGTSSPARGISLGIEGGVNWQINNGDEGKRLADVSEAYGFYVDIPLISTFFIAPEAMIYRLNLTGLGNNNDGDYGNAVTDISLNFKFVIPLGSSKIQAGMRGGASVGIKAENDWPMTVHFGFLAGYSYNFIPSLALTTRVMWEFIPSNVGNLYKLFFLAGLRFTL